VAGLPMSDIYDKLQMIEKQMGMMQPKRNFKEDLGYKISQATLRF
jgi:hypothetical protein